MVDGTRAPARSADVVVHQGRITDVCAPGDGAGTPVTLDGLTLAPGFIDIHTHYDAQVLWDPQLSPSPEHGVTTVVMGNTGFGIAPAAPAHRRLLLEVLQLVEDMDPAALAAGVHWDFETFPEYLDCLDGAPTAINVASMVGHTPVRIPKRWGPRPSIRDATADELDRMRRLMADAQGSRRLGDGHLCSAPTTWGPADATSRASSAASPRWPDARRQACSAPAWSRSPGARPRSAELVRMAALGAHRVVVVAALRPTSFHTLVW